MPGLCQRPTQLMDETGSVCVNMSDPKKSCIVERLGTSVGGCFLGQPELGKQKVLKFKGQTSHPGATKDLF